MLDMALSTAYVEMDGSPTDTLQMYNGPDGIITRAAFAARVHGLRVHEIEARLLASMGDPGVEICSMTPASVEKDVISDLNVPIHRGDIVSVRLNAEASSARGSIMAPLATFDLQVVFGGVEPDLLAIQERYNVDNFEVVRDVHGTEVVRRKGGEPT